VIGPRLNVLMVADRARHRKRAHSIVAHVAERHRLDRLRDASIYRWQRCRQSVSMWAGCAPGTADWPRFMQAQW